jgi:NitT/TauT family transport system substrate-binding protein
MKTFARATIPAIAAALVTLVAFSASAPTVAQSTATLRIGMIPIQPAAGVYYAQENGFFAKAGLNVEITQNPSTPALASAVLSGTYDISYATVATLATAHSKGLPFVMIAPGISDSSVHFGGAIMVSMTSTLKTAKDLNGKTLGAAGLNTIAEYLPRAWIDKNGGDSSTVKFVEMPFPVTADAIAAGRVDGAYMVEPFVTIAELKHLAKIMTLGDDAISPSEYLATGWFTTAEWAKAHPDAVLRFQRAMAEAAAWANANPDKVAPILAKDLKVDPALVAQARKPYYPDKMLPAQIQPWIDITAKYEKFPTFRAADLIYVPAR